MSQAIIASSIIYKVIKRGQKVQGKKSLENIKGIVSQQSMYTIFFMKSPKYK